MIQQNYPHTFNKDMTTKIAFVRSIWVRCFDAVYVKVNIDTLCNRDLDAALNFHQKDP